jgi:hypothetical protein
MTRPFRRVRARLSAQTTRVGWRIGLLAVAVPVMMTTACGGARDDHVSTGGSNTQASTSTTRPRTASGVSGRVVGRGAPVRGAAIEVASRDGQPTPALAGVTDADGRYVWRLAPGAWDVTLSASSFRTATKRVLVPSGSLVKLDFSLEPAR